MFDETNIESLDKAISIKNIIGGSSIPCIFVGNKIDLVPKGTQIDEKKIKMINNQYKIFHVSAKDNIEVDKSFEYLIEQINKYKLKE